MRLTGGAFAFVFGCAIAAAAQSAAPQTGNTTAGRSAEAMTITGCLQRTEEASTPATGTTGAAQLAPGFVLINAKSATAEAQPADVTTYALDGGGDLAPKVGQRVEVKGTLAPAPTGTSGTTPPAERHEAGSVTADTPGSVNPASRAATPRIRVTAVRVIGDCSSAR